MPPATDDGDEYEIPAERLPEGFRNTVGREVGEPVRPRPAATVILLREAASAPQILLLKRNRATGFVPGAYVFPGGRVDTADGSDAVTARWSHLAPERAATRLGLGDADPVPAIAYYTAAVREAFEETGLLLTDSRAWAQRPEGEIAAERDALLEGQLGFAELLERWDLRLDGDRIGYVAHWVTPRVEPRRYDTRFFAALVDADAEARIDPREMTDAVWLTPSAALDRHEAGNLPMIFPTIRTLEDLAAFSSAAALLDHYREAPIPMIMPEIIRTERGVSLRIPGR
ncbi:MAG: NUDIX hydrolase [Gemmatimonadota bacterium]|nr:NUDIX hydrolase [Gemmatimonadota bacterium]